MLEIYGKLLQSAAPSARRPHVKKLTQKIGVSKTDTPSGTQTMKTNSITNRYQV